jgi:hypothetical protein
MHQTPIPGLVRRSHSGFVVLQHDISESNGWQTDVNERLEVVGAASLADD